MSDAPATRARLGRVRDYYDRMAPRLVAVERRNWHLQSRMAAVRAVLDEHGPSPEAGPVLDVGCGTGFLIERLGRAGHTVVGVDLSPRSVEIANARLAEAGLAGRVRAEVGSAYEPPEGPFALITLTDVLEHLEDPDACLRALAARLAPGGLLVVSTPNRVSLPGARRWVSEHGVPWLKMNLAPVDDWQSWRGLARRGRSAGLRPVARRGIYFGPGGRVGTALGRVYRVEAVRRAELGLSRTPVGRFGFYVCVAFRPA